MKNKLLLLVCLFSVNSFAQQLHLKSNTFTPAQNVGSINGFSTWPQFSGKTYCVVQFAETPSQQDRELITAQTGIVFYYYIPDFAFLATIPLQFNVNTLGQFNIKSIIPYDASYKLHPKLLEIPLPIWMNKGGNIIELYVDVQPNIDQSQGQSLFANNNITFIKWKSKSTAVIQIPQTDLNGLTQYQWINFIQVPSAPEVLENSSARTDHRVNVIDAMYSTGLHYDGTNVSVAEGDDGVVGPHIDFKGRLFPHTNSNGGTHGDHVGGIIAGGGNFDPTTSGNARGANLHYYSYYANLTNAPTDYDSPDSIRITSNSLGQSCNAGYDADARDADILVNSKYSLMSVHSTGNSGQTSCGGVGQGFFTITGGYKAGKNVIAVGNVEKDDALAPSSSRGPSEDGRIKPDICAVGTDVYSTQPDNTYDSFTGTSMACPGVAGTLASLWQAYRDTHAGDDPASDLMKALVLNTADDLGNAGPDFKFGFGRINAQRAFKAMNEGRYIIDSVNAGGNKNYNIVVPAGTKQLKVLIYWNDKEGNPGNSVVLVNNLNMRVFDPTGAIFNPWVLDNTANTAALNSLPTRQKDNLNNVEQVTIDSLAAGNYLINVKGFSVPFGPQKFVICYEFLSDSLTLTYPQGGESFANGVKERIRWDAFGNVGTFKLEYSSDAGTSWNTLSNSIAGTRRYYDWTPPSNLNTGKMLMRISRGATLMDESDTLFSVMAVPTGLVVDTACENTFHLNWDPVPGATGYKIFMLGNKYMDEIATSYTDEYLLTTGINMIDTFYFAVSAIDTNNGGNGRRCITYVKLPGEINCLDDVYNLETILPFDNEYNCAVSSTMPIKVKLTNVGLRDLYSIPIHYQINANPIVNETITTPLLMGDTIVYTFATLANLSGVGTYNVTTWSSRYSDIYKPNDTSMATATVIAPFNLVVPTVQDFEGPLFPPQGWRVINPDNNVKWQKTLCFGGANGGNTHAAYMDFFNYNGNNQLDDLETAQLDLTNVTMDSAIVTFDVAYAYDASEVDTLSVLLSSDCTQNFYPTTYKKWGANLATVGMMTSIFNPTSLNQWRNERIDLSAYIGSKIFLRFRGINNNSNNLYIDNVNLIEKNLTPLSVNNLDNNFVSVYPNPSNGFYTLEIQSNSNDLIQYQVMNIAGQVIKGNEVKINAGMNAMSIEIKDAPSGIYFLDLKGERINQKVKLIKN